MDLEPFKLFCPYQLAWGADRSGLKLGEKSRRVGFTYFDAFDATIDRHGTHPAKPYDCWYSATDITAAEEYIGYIAEFSEMIGRVAKITEGEIEVGDDDGGIAKVRVLRATFDNGLRVTAGSSNPKFFRSKGGEVKLDELAFHANGRAMYKAAHASARVWGYPLAIWSTHHGPTSFYNQLLQQARAGKLKASVHRVTILDAVEQGLVERIRMRKERLSDVPPPDHKLRQEWLDQLRAECPDEDVWNEEYLCIPSADNSALLSYELIASATVENLRLIHAVTDLPRDHGEYYAGYDVGRRHDLSVLWVAERVGDVLWTRILRCLDRASFPAQQALIDSLMANPRVRRICIDEQGIGAQLAENAMRRWGSRAEGVTLSAPVKASLGLAFRDRFLDRQIRIPAYVTWDEFDDTDKVNRIINRRNMRKQRHRDDWLKEDLHKTRKSVTAAGNVRLAADSDADGHADAFWAGALMSEAAGLKPATWTRPVAKPLGL